MTPREPGDISVYTEARIASALARNTFSGQLCVIDNCTWPGSECDLLVVNRALRITDVEIKISRADLKADRKKDKWVDRRYSWPDGGWRPGVQQTCVETVREWPRGVWKHYYVVAAPVWKDDLLAHCGASSGVVVITLDTRGDLLYLSVKRKCRANKNSKPLSPGDVVDLARLTSLRLWDARLRQEATNAVA